MCIISGLSDDLLFNMRLKIECDVSVTGQNKIKTKKEWARVYSNFYTILFLLILI